MTGASLRLGPGKKTGIDSQETLTFSVSPVYVILHYVLSVCIMTKMKSYGVIIIDERFGITLFFDTFAPGLGEKEL